jgi:cyclopropane-fatty-acyl-phospholipid synthase
MPPISRAIRNQFLNALERIHTGRLKLTTPEGEIHHFGGSGLEAELHVHDWAFLSAVLTRGDTGLGESYVAGHWSSPSVAAVTELALRNYEELAEYGEPNLLHRLRFLLVDRVLRANSRRGSARNIRAHYDVGNEFYQLWLDPSMTYSAALFAPDDTDLERAQARKLDRILSRLGDGERVLEIGCGWGSFAERAAATGRDVTAITISPSQKGYADARLDGRANVRLEDYRQTTGRFDSIVSIEMIEAVGERYWPVYFATLKARLAEGGRVVLQAITVPDAGFSLYRRRSDYIRQNVFPGGMLPCAAAISAEAQKVGLRVTDTFAFGRDYARTCRMWSSALREHSPRIGAMGYDAAFRRGWLYYLDSCAAVFEAAGNDVVQFELSHA